MSHSEDFFLEIFAYFVLHSGVNSNCALLVLSPIRRSSGSCNVYLVLSRFESGLCSGKVLVRVHSTMEDEVGEDFLEEKSFKNEIIRMGDNPIFYITQVGRLKILT